MYQKDRFVNYFCGTRNAKIVKSKTQKYIVLEWMKSDNKPSYILISDEDVRACGKPQIKGSYSIMSNMLIQELEEWESQNLRNTNFKNLFNRFGGARKFAEAVGVDFEDLRMWVGNGYIPNAWRPVVRKAVAFNIIKNI